MNQWIDFRELRSKLRFTDVLRLYRVESNQKGDQLVGPCPLPNHPKDDRSPSFSANPERGIFQCFRCKARGNLLDFAGLMEGIDLHNGAELRRVAGKLIETLSLAEPQSPDKPRERDTQQGPVEKRVLVNEPLDFELKGLDAKHPWLQKSGLSPETIAYFGLGVAQRGYLKGRLAIPLHNLEGKLVGYAGRILDDSQITPENPKYLFPETRERNGVTHRFDPGEILYNGHRASGRIDRLTIADEPELVWRAYQGQLGMAVGLIGAQANPESLKFVLRGLRNGEAVRYHAATPPPEFLWKAVGSERPILWEGTERPAHVHAG
jgi:DNA primase